MATNNKATGWVGWVFFAGFMMILLGVFQSIFGLTALLNSDWFVVAEKGILVYDYTMWGWIHLLLGLIVLVAGFSVMQGANWARVVGVILAVLAAIGNLATINLYPVWSIAAMIVSVLVIYALTVHGEEVKE